MVPGVVVVVVVVDSYISASGLDDAGLVMMPFI